MNVLFVDDQRTNVTLLAALVRELSDAETTAVTDPAAALSWCAHREADLVMVGSMMPEIDELGFTRRSRTMKGRRTVPS